MKTSKLFSLGGVAGIVGLAVVSGCSTDGRPVQEADTATVELAIGGVSYAGNSVRIVGLRDGGTGTEVPVDTKYGDCLTSVDTCFEFNADGTLIGGGLTSLCPSSDIPAAGWTFTYEVYSEVGCDAGLGELLNAEGNPNNFVCYDIGDLVEQASPNETVDETIDPGGNLNTIMCLTTTAEKDFRFNTCEPFDTGDEAEAGFACSCMLVDNDPDPDTCDCGFDPADLPAGCTVTGPAVAPDCEAIITCEL